MSLPVARSRTLLFVLFAVVALAPAGSWAAPPARTTSYRTRVGNRLIADPRSNVKGLVRGVKPAPLLAPDKITAASLFGKKGLPDLASFAQGAGGDCYALSAAKMFGNKRSPHYAEQKEVLRSVFLEADGTLRRSAAGVPQARFFQRSKATGSYEPVLIDYDGTVPMRNGVPVYAAEAHRNGQAWGPLFEEVYTKFRDRQAGRRVGGFALTQNGGESFSVMEALTGKPATHFVVTPDNVDSSLQMITAAIERGDVVTTGSNTPPEMKARLRAMVAAGALDRRSVRLRLDDDKLIVADHEYGVVSASATAVSTSNPWNVYAVGRRGKHGIGTVRKALYAVFYGDFDIGAGTPLTR